MRDTDDPFQTDDEGEPERERLSGEEHFFDCPACGAPVSIVLDLSVESQEFVEDCEICCRPLDIAYTVEDGEVTEFSATPAQD